MPNKEGFKSWFWPVLNIALMAFVVLALVGTNALVQLGRSVQATHTITVSSEGKTTVVPDLATLNFSVVAQGADPVKLQNDNNAKIDDAIGYIKSQGVDPKDIKTTGYNLSPNYTYNPKTGKSMIDGYTLTQSVEVKVRDFTKVSPILAILPTKGINDISGPNFSVDDPDKFLNQARAEAFAKAKEKAAAIAGFADSHLGRVVTFSESTGGYPPIYFDRMSMAKGGGPVPAPAPAIEPGSQEVTVQISVTYELW